MAAVRREDILDHLTYSERRAGIRASAMAAKDLRRVRLGEHLCFLFENAETLRYQVLEMIRMEKLVREADIRRELEVYNGILGGPGELGCTLFIELPDERERTMLLRRWCALPEHLYLAFADGSRAPARFDGSQISDGKLSSVQFLKFTVDGRIPAALVSELPGLEGRATLDGPTLAALLADLAEA
jgi:hypothetical protein